MDKGWLLLGACLVLSGCSHSTTPQPDTFVILVDKSASINGEKSSSYTDYLTKYVLPSLTPGARVIMEPVAGATTHGDPESRVVTTLPAVTALKKDVWYYLVKGDMSQDKDCVNRVGPELETFYAARKELAGETARILRARETSASTYLVDGMKEASEAMEQREGRGILVVFSDGLEDSDALGRRTAFADEGFWTRQTPEALARQFDPAKAAPGLKGARVYFYGMAAGKGKVYQKVRDFWKSYFHAAQVDSVAAGHQPVYEEPAYKPTVNELCR